MRGGSREGRTERSRLGSSARLLALVLSVVDALVAASTNEVVVVGGVQDQHLELGVAVRLVGHSIVEGERSIDVVDGGSDGSASGDTDLRR